MPGANAVHPVAATLDELYRRQSAASASAEQGPLAISLVALSGERADAGDHHVAFPLQSISKVFAYALALEDHGREAVMRRVGVEPSGDAFNSITFDERTGRPHNPMVNAGALATSDLVRGADCDEKFERILDLVRRYAGNDALAADEDIFRQEMATADRNRATAYLMRSDGMLAGDVEAILALYLRQCAITVTSSDLAVMAATLANGCTNPVTGQRVLSPRVNRDVLTVMYTCGMYDFAGEWAFEVGIPAKSGVSGGIMAAVRGNLGVGVFSPGLDSFGNSVRGISVCREISERLGLHVFTVRADEAVAELGAE